MDKRFRILVTGATGFVGRHLVEQLRAQFGDSIAITLTSKEAESCDELGVVHALDVVDARAVADAVAAAQPTHVVHLSAISVPSDAGADPRAAWSVNTLGTLSVAEAILRSAPDACLIFASSGLVYGNKATQAAPFTEETLLAPSSDYAVTKASADLLLGAMQSRGLRSVRLRLFNHTGPGQSRLFVVPNFAAQIAQIEAGMKSPSIEVGRLTAVRDFVDVRDVVVAYASVIERSHELPSSPIINIATGRGYAIGEVLQKLLSLSKAQIKTESVGSHREGQPDHLIGDPSLAAKLLSWTPRYGLEESLREVLRYWRERVSSGVA